MFVYNDTWLRCVCVCARARARARVSLCACLCVCMYACVHACMRVCFRERTIIVYDLRLPSLQLWSCSGVGQVSSESGQ